MDLFTSLISINWSPAALGAVAVVTLGLILQVRKLAREIRDLEDRVLPKMSSQVRELHQWAGKEDEEGVKLMYVRRSLEDTMDKLVVAIAEQTVQIGRLLNKIDANNR